MHEKQPPPTVLSQELMQLMKLQVKKEAPEGIFNTNQKQNDITAAFIYRFACVRRADI